ncbi:MAG: CAP domain-containing protein [Candidatus Paceibacterota bacterium]
MISWFKKHFIPHEGNEHRPHILRGSNIRNIVIVVIFLETLAFLIPTLTRINITGGMATVLPAVLAQLTNQERKEQNLQTLVVNPILNEAAEMKAEDMAAKSYFAHTSPEGKTPWYWLEKVGYEYQYAGENLAINFSDSKDVTEAWMASPTHKANIVKGNYTEIGTGVATGIYKGRETVFVAQVYANPIKNTTKRIQSKETEAETTPGVANAEKSSDVLGAEINTPADQDQKVAFWQKIFASPRNSTNTILYVIFGIIIFALLLNIFIKIKHQHPDLITNGLIALAIIGAIFVVNNYLSKHNMTILESIDYSNEIK